MIGGCCLESLTLPAATGCDMCTACLRDLLERDLLDRGDRAGWSACLEYFGLVADVASDEAA